MQPWQVKIPSLRMWIHVERGSGSERKQDEAMVNTCLIVCVFLFPSNHLKKCNVWCKYN